MCLGCLLLCTLVTLVRGMSDVNVTDHFTYSELPEGASDGPVDYTPTHFKIFGQLVQWVTVNEGTMSFITDEGRCFILQVEASSSETVKPYYHGFLDDADEHPDKDLARLLVNEFFDIPDNQCDNLTLIVQMTIGSNNSILAETATISCEDKSFVAFRLNIDNISFAIYADVELVNVADISQNITGNTGVEGLWMFRLDLCSNCLVLPRNSGFCYGPTCICFDGYAGWCCTETTLDSCHFHLAELNVCLDDVFESADDLDPSLNPCLHGNYSLTEDGGYDCHCHPGYEGDRCEDDVDDCVGVNCSGHGLCVDGLENFTCLCFPGYEGDQCETPSNPCASSPCLHGKCTSLEQYSHDQNDTYHCSCYEGFTGTNCDSSVCGEEACSGHGVCVNDRDRYKCMCSPGSPGLQCEFHDDICSASPCYFGECIQIEPGSYTCQCTPGYTGMHCEVNVNDCDPDPCEHGVCLDGIENYTCSCFPGFSGPACDEPSACNWDTCMHGSCVNDSCQCLSGYVGSNCDEKILACDPNPCQSGTCFEMIDDFHCDCFPGYTGKQCDVHADPCDPDPCINGYCVQNGDSFVCEACPGFTGSLCETKIDFCLSSPCGSLGTCRPFTGGYVCDCVDDVTGDNCDIDNRLPRGTFDSWQAWAEFPCSKTCDFGIQRRYRQCLRTPCLEKNYQTRPCRMATCPGDLLEDEYVVLLTSPMSLVEVIESEDKLREVVASHANIFCQTYPARCCIFVSRGIEIRSFKPVITEDHVFVAKGYPRPLNSGKIMIGLVVKLSTVEFVEACLATKATVGRPDYVLDRPVRSMFSTDKIDQTGWGITNETDDTLPEFSVLHLPREVLYRIIKGNEEAFNDEQNLCCFQVYREEKVVEVDPDEKVPQQMPNIVLGTLVPIAVIIIILFFILFCLSVRPSQVKPTTRLIRVWPVVHPGSYRTYYWRPSFNQQQRNAIEY